MVSKKLKPQPRRVDKENLVGLVSILATKGKHGRIKRAEEDLASASSIAERVLNNARVIRRDVSHIRENGIITMLQNNMGGVTDAVMSAAPEALSCVLMSSTGMGALGCLAKTAYGLYQSRLSSSAAPQNRAAEKFEDQAAQSTVKPAENTSGDLAAPPDP